MWEVFLFMSTKIEHKDIDFLLNEIGERLFQVKELTDGDSMDTVLLWDSMGHMELMVALEQSFQMTISPEEIIDLTSVEAIKIYLKDRE